MTGDNNGRWAGSYDWPDNQQSYIDNARATILALRPHASLLLLCGGNELSPANQSPPPYIAANLQNLITILDSKRFYIPSSMSPQTADPNEYDPQYALSCQDGPYGILFPSQYYNERNPGEPLYTSSFISYQPEVGSVSMPVLRSLKRFLPPESLIPGAVPHYLANDKDVPEAWQYHKYLPFTTDTYDHIYAYSADYQNGSDPNTLRNLIAKEFAMRAQIIQLQQYQALYEGFSLFQWRYYSAVLLWKSQSPWPALRGALYDYYLDYTGGYWGVRNALSMYSTEDICMGTSSSTVCVDSLGMISSAGLHAMFNPTTRQVSVINRHAVDSRNGVAVRVSCFDLYGKELSSHVVSIGLVPSNGVVTSDESITWPAGLDNKTVVLFFLELVTMNSSSSSSKDDVGAKVLLPNLYWLSSPSNGDRHDYSQLGKLQLQTPAQVTSTVKLAWTRSSNKQDSDQELLKLGLTGAHLVAAQEPIASARYSGGVKSSVGFSVIEISCSTNSPAVAFMMQLTLLTSDPSATDPRVLPTFFSLNYITLRPGESVYVVVASSTEYSSGSQILEIDGWNVPTFTLVA